MKRNELKKNGLYTPTEYADAMGKTPSRLTYLYQTGKLKTVHSESGKGWLVVHCEDNEKLFK